MKISCVGINAACNDNASNIPEAVEVYMNESASFEDGLTRSNGSYGLTHQLKMNLPMEVEFIHI